ncbi:MAG: hypothetical protein QOH12_2805 [Solirubrobacteraceae bacterium]|jgi:hypothetical protein|nr:hypothetical protein [Solirubrobacteraceae bacterium]
MTGPDEHPPEEASVLSSLPGTRPQRRSPKRAAPKSDAADPTAASAPAPATPRRARPPRARRPAVTSQPPKPDPLPPIASVDPASTGDRPGSEPRRVTHDPPLAAQGFEVDPVHGAVNPPTGAELLASVAQGATELVEIGLTLTRRLARSVLDRLPRL